MINQDLINSLPSKSGFLYNHISNPIDSGNYTIVKGPISGCWEVYKKGNVNMLYNDSLIFIDEYAKKIKNLNFSSILFAGLGLGILPYLSQDLTEIIDVVEIDKEIIDIVKNINHLSSKINITHDNIFNFSTDKKYDVILFDIWDGSNKSQITSQSSMLIQKFIDNLNEGGFMYTPILEW